VFTVPIQSLSAIRDRVLPMFQVAADQYRGRVPNGYPNVVDESDRGLIGLEIDANYSLFITADPDGLYAEMYRRQSRTDARSSAGRQKYGGLPFQDRRPIAADIADQAVRNLIGELMHHYNMQPGLLYITDD
jgi:hypothetical protein